MSIADNRADSGRSANRTVAQLFGAVYALVGLAGFFVSETFAGRDDDTLLGFEVNHLHNVVHLLIGVALLGASRQHSTARAANLAVGASYLLLAVVGPVLDDTDANVVALNGADHVLHLLSGLLLVGTALIADRRAPDRSRG